MERRTKGFTLVEVIVVLVILAILAAILIPSMINWISKAEEKIAVADARNVFIAAKAAVVEQYVSDHNFKLGAEKFVVNGIRCGRVTDNMLYNIQNSKLSEAQINDTGNYQKTDAVIAKNILQYLNSSDKRIADYKFNSNHAPFGELVSQYWNTYKQPGVYVSYLVSGEINFVEYGINDILVRIEGKTSKLTIKKGSEARFSN